MKKILILFIFVWSAAIASQAQSYKPRSISPDSLLVLFETGIPPFEILESLRDITYMDFEAMYRNAALKPYVMRWLDREEYLQHEINKEVKARLADTEFLDNLILSRLKSRGNEQLLATVMADPALYKVYRDSVASENIEQFRLSYEKQLPFPPSDAIYFHSLLAYPESYLAVKEIWEEKGKDVNENEYFIALLRMGDPEAKAMFDRWIRQMVQSNGESHDMMETYSILDQVRGSYSVDKLLELLKVNANFVMLSEGDSGQPFNCVIMDALVNQILLNRIEASKAIKRNQSCKVHFSNLKHIKRASNELKESYDQEQKYWRVNMPYLRK